MNVVNDKKNVAIAILAGIILLGGALLGKFTYEQHKMIADATAASAADIAKIKSFEDDRLSQAQADAAQQKSAQTTKANVKTSADAVRTIIQYVTLPAAAPDAPPQTTVIAKTDLSTAEQAKVPDSPSYSLQTQDAAVATAKTLIQCKVDQTSLTSCTKQISDLVVERDTYKAQSDTWENTAKGGSKAKRLLKFAECAATTAGGAAAGSLTKDTKYAAIGAAAGFTACQFLF
jgi:hypothetical protein